MAWAKYRSDETVGAIAWFCYLLFFFTFSIVFAFVVWPTMSEEMSWAGDQCFVVSHNTTCLDEKLAYCGPSVKVLLTTRSAGNPVCPPEVGSGSICSFQERTIEASASALPYQWIREHKVGETYPCWQRTVDDASEATFDVAVTQGSTALFVWPVLSSVVFLLSAVVLVPAFVRPDGLGGKLLALCGVERSVEESEASVHPGILADATADVHMSGILMAPLGTSEGSRVPILPGRLGEHAV